MNRYIIPILISFFISTLCTGQIGVITTVGDFTFTAQSTYQVQIDDLSGAGYGHDHLAVTGDLNLDGVLDINLEEYDPDVNDAFIIISYLGNVTGTFSNIIWPAEMSAQGWNIDYGILDPGHITIYAPNNSLPIKLTNFQVLKDGKGHLLLWESSSEINADNYQVQHALGETEFIPLGEVKAKGSENSEQKYQFYNNSIVDGLHYYRLKMVDLDGSSEYSEIISIVEKGEKYMLFPNPTNGEIYLSKEAKGIIVNDLQGKLIAEKIINSDHYDLSELATGTYIIEVLLEHGLVSKHIIRKI